jgi:hypothetical protein
MIICRLCTGVVFTNPPKTTDDGKALFAKYPQKPDKLPIRYYTDLNSETFQPVCFSNVHGAELELYCEYKVALRKRLFNRKMNETDDDVCLSSSRCSKTRSSLSVH